MCRVWVPLKVENAPKGPGSGKRGAGYTVGKVEGPQARKAGGRARRQELGGEHVVAAAFVSYEIRLLGNRLALKSGWGGGLPSEDAAEERRIEAFGGRQPSLNFSHSYFVF